MGRAPSIPLHSILQVMSCPFTSATASEIVHHPSLDIKRATLSESLCGQLTMDQANRWCVTGSLSASNIPGSGAISRGVKRSRSPEAYGEFAGGDDDGKRQITTANMLLASALSSRLNAHADVFDDLADDGKPRKRGRPPKTPRASGGYEATGGNHPQQQHTVHSMAEAQMRTPQIKHESLPQTTPTQTSPPSKTTPTKPVVKALPTVRDHTTDQLNPEGDEYLPRETDEAGEKKVDAMGRLQGNRQYRCRTFTVPHRGERLFMLATECARVLSYRDSYLLFNKNRSLYKIIASQEEKDDLIAHDFLPYSYRSRQIAIVTARSMFRQFGSRVIVNGRRVRDDYWEAKARKQGFTEEDLAGEKRPGAAKARESAAAESAQAGAHVSNLANADILYTNGPPMEGMPHPPAIQPGMTGLNSSLGRLPMINSADDMRIRDFSNIPRPRQEMSGPPYQDRTQPSSQGEILNQASHTADFNKILNQQRNYRAKGLDEYWNKPREVPVSTPPPTAGGVSTETGAVGTNYQSPNLMGADMSSTNTAQQSSLLSHHSGQHQQIAQPAQSLGYPNPQTANQYTANTSPMRAMHQAQLPTPQQQQHPQPPQFHQRPSSSNFQMPGAPQPSPYGYGTPQSHQQHPSQQQMWGGPPPQPQQSPMQQNTQNRMPTPSFSPHLSQQHPGQIHSPVAPSQSPHAQQHQPPQLMHQASASMQGMYGSGYPRANMGIYPGQPSPGMGQQQYMQPGHWPVSQAGGNQQWPQY